MLCKELDTTVFGEASRYARYDSGTTFTATMSEVIERDLDRSDTGKVRASTPSTAEAAADKWGAQTSGVLEIFARVLFTLLDLNHPSERACDWIIYLRLNTLMRK